MKLIYSSGYPLVMTLLLFSVFQAEGQKKMRGGVVDQEGRAVKEAGVFYQDQPEQRVATDLDGGFYLDAVSGGVLTIEVPGLYRKFVRVADDSAGVILTRHDEVVPTGFGIEYLRDELTSSVGMVRAPVLSRNMAINPANALFGTIPGLSVMQNGGTSWENDPDIFIRGVGTFNNASPLVLVDGFERPLSSLSLPEIESVVVLKDAATLALYGHRGANGVLLVTTRRGAYRSSRVNVRLEQGVTQAFRLPELLGGYRYAQSYNQARLNDGLSPAYSTNDIEKIRSGTSPYLYPDVDWFKEAFRPSGTTSLVNVSLDGNSKYIRHFTTLNYQKDNGLLGPVNDNEGYDTQLRYQKLNFRTNLDVDVTSSTLFRVNLSGNLRQTNTPGRNISEIMNGIYTVPSAAFPVKTYDGEWGGTSIYGNNPVALVSSTGFVARQTRELLADVSLAQKLDLLLPGLVAEASVAYDNSASYLDAKTKRFRYQEIRPLTNEAGAVTDTASNLFGNNTELAYSSTLESQWRHATFRGKLMYSKIRVRSKLQSAVVLQQDKLVRNGQFNTYLRQLIAGNAHYSLDDRYFISGAVSYSGTNMLPRNSRYAFFPALSMGWKVSDEDWFRHSGWLRYLKLRGSWGMTGSDLIPQNIVQQQFSSASAYYFTPNNVAAGGIVEGQLGTHNLSGEVSTKTNVGLDFDLNGFELTMDVFHDRRTGILVESGGINSAVVGVIPPYQNAGITVNRGVEIGFSAYSAPKAAFTYQVGGQFSFVKNKIVEMKERFHPFSYQRLTGQRIHQAFGLEAEGFFADEADIASSPRQLFSETRPGDIKYRDQNGDGIVDQYDEKPVGYSLSNPEIYFSASFHLGYKGIGLFALFQGAANQTLYLNTPGVFWPLRGNSTISTYSDNSWTPATSASASLPRLSTLENVNNYRPNDLWLVNGAFAKLRSVELSYDLPEKLVAGWKCSSLRVYVRGNNLLSIDKLKIMDPENTGIAYPTLSSYNLGVQVGF